MEIPITQSLMKAWYNYLMDKECGLLIEAKFFMGMNFEPSEAQHIGIYFEYVAFGTLPKSGKVPIPKVRKLKKGQTQQQGELVKKYENAYEQAQKIKGAIKHYGLQILSSGSKLQSKMDGIEVEGTIDLEFLTEKPLPITNKDTGGINYIPPGTLVFGDAKTTGLLGDRGKWNESGWHPDFLSEKDTLMIQAVHYTMIGMDIYNKTEIPFIFLVYSQSNDVDSMWASITIDPIRYESHRQMIISTFKGVTEEYRKGFKAKPELDRCARCPLFDNCNSKIIYPKIYDIYY